jgi:hypothetical protein
MANDATDPRPARPADQPAPARPADQPAPARDPDETAARLLDAQIDFFLALLGPDQFEELVTEEVDHWLATVGGLSMERLVSREDVKAVARKYATGLTIPGAIPELAGEAVARIYRDPAQDRHRLGELTADGALHELIEKLTELPVLQRGLAANPVTQAVLAARLHGLAHLMIEQNRRLAERLPGAASLLDAVLTVIDRARPGGLPELDARLAELSGQIARRLLALIDHAPPSPHVPDLAGVITELIDDNAERPVGALRAQLSAEDLEDLLVLGYEFWRRLRETDYLRSLIDAGVDFVFDKYGQTTLRELLDEFAITREDLIEEAMRFAPSVIATLRENGMLAAVLRRRLAPFFASDEVRSLLA